MRVRTTRSDAHIWFTTVSAATALVVLSEYLRYIFACNWPDWATFRDYWWLLWLSTWLILQEVVEGGANWLAVTKVQSLTSSAFLRLSLLWLASAAKISDAVRLATPQPSLCGHDLLWKLGWLHTWRSWEVVHTWRVTLDRIVLFESSIRWLHQALWINLTIKIFFSSLQLRSQLVGYDLLLLTTAFTLHHLMDADAAIIAKFDWSGLIATMLSEIFQTMDILLRLIWI